MTTIKLKNGSGAPAAGDLVQGEPALDLTNKRLYTEDSGGNVIEVGINPTSVTTGDVVATSLDISGDIDVDGTTNLDVVDIDGAVDMASTLAVGGVVTANAGVVVDNITIDGNEISTTNNNGNLTLTPNGTGNVNIHTDAVVVLADEGESASLFLAADQGDDNADFWAVTHNSSNTLTIGNQISGSIVDHITITPNATVTNSIAAFAGKITAAGSVTADGLTSAGNVLVSQSGANSTITINRTDEAPEYNLTMGQSGSSPFITGNDAQDFHINVDPDNTQSGSAFNLNIDGNIALKANAGGDISFYEDTGTTAKFFWDASAERFGLGTTSPNTALHLSGLTGSPPKLTLEEGGAESRIYATKNSPTNSDLRFQTEISGTIADRMVINYSGNVGIGTSSIDNKVNIQESALSGRDPSNGNTSLTIEHATDTGIQFFSATQTQIRFGDAASTGAGSIIYDHTTDRLRLTTNELITFEDGGVERMRIDASGNLLIGTTTTNIATEGTVIYGAGNEGVMQLSSTAMTALYVNRSNDGELVQFRAANSTVGSISVASSTTSYNTSSDQRLKENIVDAPSASDDIDAIQVRSFDWKADGSHQKYGMIAQELQTVAPEAVTEGETEEDMMGVDYSKLVPMMLKEIQSLRARVAQLEGVN